MSVADTMARLGLIESAADSFAVAKTSCSLKAESGVCASDSSLLADDELAERPCCITIDAAIVYTTQLDDKEQQRSPPPPIHDPLSKCCTPSFGQRGDSSIRPALGLLIVAGNNGTAIDRRPIDC